MEGNMLIVERTKALLMATGAAWVLWVLIALSMASLAVIAERAIALRSLRGTAGDLYRTVLSALRRGGTKAVRDELRGIDRPAATLTLRAVEALEAGDAPSDIEHTIDAEVAIERRRLERGLGFLSTLGANAPFIGLLGTVIGILQAFDAFGTAGAGPALAPQAVMSSIAEALVATAVGLGVAIPAIMAYNAFESRIGSAVDDARTLVVALLPKLAASAGGQGRADIADAPATEPAAPPDFGWGARTSVPELIS
jgi:biopolymer transport protein ExbB